MDDMVIAIVFPEIEDSEKMAEIIDRAQKVAKDIPDVKIKLTRGDAASTIKFFVQNGELPVDQDISPTYEPTNRTYKKKPLQIEAVQLSWGNWSEVCDFLGDVINENNPAYNILKEDVSDTCGEPGPEYIALKVVTTHGEEAVVRHGDWIIPDSKPGTFYPCKPDVFEKTYEKVVM